MSTLKNKTIFMSGGSRGIGLAIALRAAADGANVVVAAKTAEPHLKLPGTIYTAAEEIEAAGGQALPVICDIRDEKQVAAAVDGAVERFGGIDICINNASAIQLTPTEMTDMKRFDRALRAIKVDQWKYIWASDGKHELYDLASDPTESNNLIELHPEIAQQLQLKLEEWVDGHEMSVTSAEPEIDSDLKFRLEALGYM